MPELDDETRRCPYCDRDEDDIDGDLGEHVMACQPFRVRD